MPPFNRPTQAILQQQNPPEMLQLNPTGYCFTSIQHIIIRKSSHINNLSFQFARCTQQINIFNVLNFIARRHNELTVTSTI